MQLLIDIIGVILYPNPTPLPFPNPLPLPFPKPGRFRL